MKKLFYQTVQKAQDYFIIYEACKVKAEEKEQMLFRQFLEVFITE